jgi:hypothetical protein
VLYLRWEQSLTRLWVVLPLVLVMATSVGRTLLHWVCHTVARLDAMRSLCQVRSLNVRMGLPQGTLSHSEIFHFGG